VAAALLAPAPSTTPVDESVALFAYGAAKNARLVAELLGFHDPASSGVTVRAEIRHVQAPEEREPQRLCFAFPDREQAQQFVDETLTALEYLGCTISPIDLLAGLEAGTRPRWRSRTSSGTPPEP
jgi:hypothetical protein